MKKLIRKIIGRNLCERLSWVLRALKCFQFFWYDYCRFVRYSGGSTNGERESKRAVIIMTYHVIEKGLTMPFRRKKFGKETVSRLMVLIEAFEDQFGLDDEQVKHAVGVLKEYRNLHSAQDVADDSDSTGFWQKLDEFCARHPDVESSEQLHCTYDSFYANNSSIFPEFAKSRHTLRHYSNDEVSVERIKEAVEIALTSPSACNRQHCRVHCVSDKQKITDILALQHGSRGFGEYANKLLIVTTDLEDIIALGERTDAFTNGGIFLMNLCYSLHYFKIAHCILNWSRTPFEDIAVRKLISIKPSESIVAVLTCGEAPEEFDVAASPRKDISEIFSVD